MKAIIKVQRDIWDLKIKAWESCVQSENSARDHQGGQTR